MLLYSYILIYYKICYIPKSPKTTFNKVNWMGLFFSNYFEKSLSTVFWKVEVSENVQDINSTMWVVVYMVIKNASMLFFLMAFPNTGVFLFNNAWKLSEVVYFYLTYKQYPHFGLELWLMSLSPPPTPIISSSLIGGVLWKSMKRLLLTICPKSLSLFWKFTRACTETCTTRSLYLYNKLVRHIGMNRINCIPLQIFTHAWSLM